LYKLAGIFWDKLLYLQSFFGVVAQMVRAPVREVGGSIPDLK